MIQEDYVSFEVAKLLKEKGFDKSCSCVYPTQAIAMAWLREVYNLPINIWFDDTEDIDNPENKFWNSEVAIGYPYCMVGRYDTYEEAVEAALKYTFENLI